MLSTWDGRAGSFVTQYFSFFVQLGDCIIGASIASLRSDTFRDMEVTFSTFRRPLCEGPRR